jgi:chaperone BCS1
VRGRDEDDVETAVFKKYTLSSNKQLEHVAHPAVPQIRQTLRDLMDGTGKFAVEGHARKATFLLHGPPGTGKTTLIKAIANFTRRHIISINLANIQSSQEFMDVMFSDRIGAHGSAVKVRNQDVIFVMEDVDAACNIIKDRGGRGAPAACARDPKPNADHEVYNSQRDPLTLATILNVLDGALECENRIVIMTTNYVDRIDRALVRPGRVTLNLEMGYIRAEQAVQMIGRYFPGAATELTLDQVERALDGKSVTPAEIEMACSYCDTVNGVDGVLAEIAAAGQMRLQQTERAERWSVVEAH